MHGRAMAGTRHTGRCKMALGIIPDERDTEAVVVIPPSVSDVRLTHHRHCWLAIREAICDGQAVPPCLTASTAKEDGRGNGYERQCSGYEDASRCAVVVEDTKIRISKNMVYKRE